MPLNAIYEIGKIVSQDKDQLDSLIKVIKVSDKNDYKNFNLKIVFDLKENQIIISNDWLSDYKPDDIKKYSYCGNNSARGKQYYLTRLASNGLKYVCGKMFLDLRKKMSELGLNSDENNLYKLLNLLIASDLYDEENQQVIFSKIKTDEPVVTDEISVEILKKMLFGTQKKDVFGKNIYLIIPTIRTETDEIFVLPETPEYKEVVLSKLNKNQVENKKMIPPGYSFCYICQKEVPASSSFISAFPRDAISKIFITQKINYASLFEKANYDKNYKFCEKCRDILLNAEKYIKNNLNFKMANVSTFVIPAFLVRNLEVGYEKNIRSVKRQVELAFSKNTLELFIESLEVEMGFLGFDFPVTLTFLSYETDGNSFKIINLIKDIPEFNFIKLTRTFIDEHSNFIDKIKKFNLNTIFKLIPVKHDKKGGASSKRNNVLELYSNLFNLNPISAKTLYSYFCQALYFNYYNQGNIYKNLFKYDSFDFAIYNFFYYYLILFNTLKKLNLIFEDYRMEAKTAFKKSSQDDKEKFVTQQGFNEQQQALFYLGLLINQVGYSQSKAGHHHKPILNKINYQGMTKKDIQRLYLEVFEKLVQYRSLYPTVESDHRKFKENFDRNFDKWQLNDEENIFFLLSGYAYKIGTLVKSEKNQPEDDPTEN